MAEELSDKRIAILTEEGFEEVELSEPRKALKEAGARADIVSPNEDEIRAWDHDHWSDLYNVDVHLNNAITSDYDGLFLPGGVLNPDKLRANKKAVDFVNSFFNAGKPIAAICHGPQTMIETGKLNGRTMTSYHSVKTDLKNAGVNWVDQEVVVDEGLVTSRNPDDIPAFIDKMIEEFREGVHEEMAK